jgi:hypothetical protein
MALEGSMNCKMKELVGIDNKGKAIYYCTYYAEPKEKEECEQCLIGKRLNLMNIA